MGSFTAASFLLYGLKYFTRGAYEQAEKEFVERSFQVPATRSFIVTGANAGLGRSTAESIARAGGCVHLVCRSPERGATALHEIKEKTGNPNVHLHIADLSSMRQIREFHRKFLHDGHHVDVLINNAGVLLSQRQQNEDGIELTLATNTLSTFLLTELFLPHLRQREDARVIVVSSGGMLTSPLLIGEDYEKGNYDGTVWYSRTKRHQVALVEKWHEIEQKVKFYSVHPGWAETPGVQTSLPAFYERLKDKLRTSEQGADAIVWLALSNRIKPEFRGQFIRDRTLDIKHFCITTTRYNREKLELLWHECLQLTAEGNKYENIVNDNVVQEMFNLLDLNNEEKVWTENEKGVFSRAMDNSKLRAIKVSVVCQCGVRELEDLLHTKMIERHSEWNKTFTGGVIVETISDDVNVQLWKYELSGITNRDFLVVRRRVRLPNNHVMLIDKSTVHPLCPETKAPIDNTTTELVYMNLTDLRGWLPTLLTNKANPSVSLEEVQHIKALCEADARRTQNK